MAKCEILETFKGSQDGRFTETFEAGTTAEISEYLIACAPKGALKIAGEAPVVENKATITTTSRSKAK